MNTEAPIPRAHDSLQRFVFEHAPVRGQIVRLDATWRAVLQRRDYPLPVRDLLGETMAAASLLAASIKFDGRLTMQVTGNGPVRLLVVECTSRQTLRGLAQWNGPVPVGGVKQLLGDGKLVITIEPDKGERYQGVVELDGEMIADVLEHYFARSEQLATRLWLAADDTQAAGMLLQRLPRDEHHDPDTWDRAVHLGATITRDELLTLPVPTILRRLYHEEDIRLFSGRPVSFRCSCSRPRVESVLRMLGHEEVSGILAERGKVEVDCEFCGSHYELDRVDAEQLFAAAHMTDPSPTRH
ncbi:MAG: Hsp33 family molecular chaperone HslO [Pseudomonadota bacterium]|nr:MAG: Hsp33 family molecular chaperone HslO [Pseudomonadota bacterium]